MPRALVTGITGQDGSYLAELLLEKGYEVHGMLRPGVPPNFERIEAIRHRLALGEANLRDDRSIRALVDRVRPHEIYNLAGNGFVPESWERPIETADVMGLGPVRLLEAIRAVDPSIRFLQVGSSEIFGHARSEPQDESTPPAPRAPYGAAKAYAHAMTASYRRQYGLFAASAIAYNHESPRRNPRFVTRKITQAAACIKRGLAERVTLGNLDAQRDWGFAGDFVRGMWLMLQADEPDDYILATGVTHSVRQVAELAFGHVGLDWQAHVNVDPALIRGGDETKLRGNASKARRQLGWEPGVSLAELIRMMVDADLPG
jgi:GDPmannose 4,6-dehydratase